MKKLVVIDSKTPLVEDRFYQYLSERHTHPGRFVDDVKAYLKHIGFMGNPKSDHLHILKHVYEHYCMFWVPVAEPFKLSELIQIRNFEHPDLFWINSDRDRPAHGRILPKLQGLIDEHFKDQFVYQLAPKNYYFEVRDSMLWLKYQHIIGSRPICILIDEGKS